jgi:hypothetical protein
VPFLTTSSPDGRSLIATVVYNVSAPFTLLQNWNSEAKK